MKEIINNVINGQILNEQQAGHLLEFITDKKSNQFQIAATLGAMRSRGEVTSELIGFSRGLINIANKLNYQFEQIVDTCGTGGDGLSTFNISTAVSFIAASGGLNVAKHGNRSVSSLCGSADILEELGIRMAETPEEGLKQLKNHNYSFLFAPKFHPSFKKIAPIRRNIGTRTIFNLLGPLVNPAPITHQILGVFDSNFLGPMAETLHSLGRKKALVVHGNDGMDEISLSEKTNAIYLDNGKLKSISITPEDAGLKRAPLKEIKGGDCKTNSSIILEIFSGEKGPRRDVVVLNTAALFLISGKVESLNKGARLAEELIDSKKAMEKIEELRSLS
jgi:anthranilate phosphoribosyltransferase